MHGPTDLGGGDLELSAGNVNVEGNLTTSHANLNLHATNDIFIGSYGAIQNDAGSIRVNAPSIEHDGSIIAHGGQVHLDSGDVGTTIVRGSIDVSQPDAGKPAGSIHILGSQVGLLGNAQIDATATVGAGTILIGGDYQGKNSAIRNALRTYVGSNVVIRADAVETGNGGKVIVWADEVTRFYGTITARGGATSGDGGFIETSGKQQLDFQGTVSASAANGAAGTWLLDPENITIGNAGTANIVTDLLTIPGTKIFAPAVLDTTTRIKVDDINSALDGGTSVVINTTNPLILPGVDLGTITINAAIEKSAGGDATLTFNADNAIFLNDAITSTVGALNVVFNGTVVNIDAAGTAIDTNGGDVTFNSPVVLQKDTILKTTGLATGQLSFNGTVNGIAAGTESLAITGNAVFGNGAGDYVGNMVALEFVTVSGTTQFNAGNAIANTVKTAEVQTYTGAVSLGANTTLTSTGLNALGNITIGGTLTGGGNDLTVNTAGTTSFAIITGIGALVTDLSGNGTTVFNNTVSATSVDINDPLTIAGPAGGGLVSTTTTQDYAAVTLGVDTTLTSTGLNALGNITIGGTLTGGGNDLTVNTAGTTSFAIITGIGALVTDLSGNGTTVFNNTVSATSVDINDPLTIAGPAGGGLVSTTTTQDYAAVTLGVDTTLTSTGLNALGNITIGGTLTGGGNDLTVNTAGTTSFAIITGIGALVTDLSGNGTTVFNNTVSATSVDINDPLTIAGPAGGGLVSTTTTQDYAAVTLGVDTTLTSTGLNALGNITIGGTLTGGGNDLTVNTAGTTSFAIITGIGALVTDLSGNGTTVFNNTVSATSVDINDPLTIAGPAGGGLVSTTTTQDYAAVTLGVDTTLTGITISFGGTVNGVGAGTESLAITGNAVFGDGAGDFVGNTFALEFLTVSGTTRFNAGNVPSNTVKTAGLQTYTGAATLGADTTLEGSTISFNGIVNGDVPDRNLTITVGLGNAMLTGAVGAIQNLGLLTVISANQATFGSTVRANDIDLTATTVRFTSDVTALVDDVDVKGNFVLLGNVVVTTGAGANDDFNVTGTTNGNIIGRDLTVIASLGNVVFTGAIGNAVGGALGSLTITSANDATFNAVTAASFTQLNGTGTTTFNGVQSYTGSFGFNGNALTINRLLTAGSAMTVTNAGLFKTGLNGDIKLTGAGAFLQDGAGTNSLAADINTTNQNITFTTAIGLTDTVSMISIGGGILLTGIDVAPAVVGLDLTLNSSTVVAGANGGTVLLGTFSGQFLNDLTIDSRSGAGGIAGQIPLGINLFVDAIPGDEGSVTLAGDVRLTTNVSIDTSQAPLAGGGPIMLANATVSATLGFDLILDASTGAVGLSGGAVTLGAFGDGAGQFVHDLTIRTGGPAAAGALTLTNNVMLDHNGITAARFRLLDGGNVIVAGNATIDTEQGNLDTGGNIELGIGQIFGSGANRRLLLDAQGVANGGTIDFGTVAAGGGSLLGQFRALTNGTGVLTLDNPITVQNLGNALPLADAGITVQARTLNIDANMEVKTSTGNIHVNALLKDVTAIKLGAAVTLKTIGGQIGADTFANDGTRFTLLHNLNTRVLDPGPGDGLTLAEPTATIQVFAADVQGINGAISNYDIVIDWTSVLGLPAPPPDIIGAPVPNNDPDANLNARFVTTGINGNVAFTFQHTYAENPNQNDAQDIDGLVAIQRIAGGTIQVMLGDLPLVAPINNEQVGIFEPFVIPVLELPTVTPQLPETESLSVNPPPPPAVEARPEIAQPVESPTQQFVPITSGVASSGEERYYELRIVSFDKDGKLVEDREAIIKLNDPALKAIYPFDPSKLPTLFGRLPADRYRIYLIEDGAERLILDFTIQQGQPIETPELEDTNSDMDEAATDPFGDERAAPQEPDAVPASNENNGERPATKNGASNSSSTSKAADAFAERLGKTSFLSHGGVVVGAAALAFSASGRWEQSIDRLMERFDRRRRSPNHYRAAKRERQLLETSTSNSAHNPHQGS